MKQFLLAASACVGLFAFTRVGGSRDQRMATTMHSYNPTDTSKKPKPDSIGSVSYLLTVQMDTTKKPKPDSIGTVAFFESAQMDTTKPKPDSMRLALR